MSSELLDPFPTSVETRHQIDRILAAVDLAAPSISLVFVTNISNGPILDVDETGVIHTAQFYTRNEADEIIRSFQNAGFHVLSYFSEQDFIKASLSGELDAASKAKRVVYSAAEGGTGAGRRALIPAFCNLLKIPVCNSGPHGCSVARHKFHANSVLACAGLRVPKTWMFSSKKGWIGGRSPELGSRVIIKPTFESMSIGIDDSSVAIVDVSFDEVVMRSSLRFAQPCIVQEFITGYEIGVPIVELEQPVALPIVGFAYDESDRYGDRPRTFDDENLSNHVRLFRFSHLPTSQYEAIQRAAVVAFEVLDMAGIARIDMRVDDDGRAWIFDTNEAPPPLPDTSYGSSLQQLGYTTTNMLALWVGVTLKRYGLIEAH